MVARQLGKPCVAGCSELKINLEEKYFIAGDVTIREGDFISLNGGKGTVYAGKMPVVAPRLEEQTELLRILGWADSLRRLMVWANADDEEQASRARSYGAQGIGLCRTEHMFLGDRTQLFQNYILAADDASKKTALEKLAVLQHDDFYGIFRAMDGLPVIIRLIDPPLHEFLPGARSVDGGCGGWARARRRRLHTRNSCCTRLKNWPSSTRCWACAVSAWAS